MQIFFADWVTCGKIFQISLQALVEIRGQIAFTLAVDFDTFEIVSLEAQKFLLGGCDEGLYFFSDDPSVLKMKGRGDFFCHECRQSR